MISYRFISLLRITPVPAGSYAVVSGSVRNKKDLLDENGHIKRSLWKNYRIFKRKGNAERYKHKLVQQGWNEFLISNNIISLN